jgi:hypothetical protein
MKRKVIVIHGLVRQCVKNSCDFQQKPLSQKQLRNTSLEHPQIKWSPGWKTAKENATGRPGCRWNDTEMDL